MPLDVVFIGLAFTSSWGNGHATTYRSLIKGLHARGHRILFLEHDQPWYAAHRDLPAASYCEVALYSNLTELRRRFAARIRSADAVIVGSYVFEGQAVGDWVLDEARGIRAFYDIDTPVTLANLRADTCAYLRRDQIGRFDIVLSFTGGPVLDVLETTYGARQAEALYCSVDVDRYQPRVVEASIDLGYMGTYSQDRQPGLERLLFEPARALPDLRFQVAGAQYPKNIAWPANVAHREHLSPANHAQFYCKQRFTLNITREDMRAAGYSPSVRLFEAAACATPIISDDWPGLGELFESGREILIAKSGADVREYLTEVSDADRMAMAQVARERVLELHTGAHRAAELERYLSSTQDDKLHVAAQAG